MARTISSSFAANRRMISSGGSAGATDLLDLGGGGNFVDSGGAIGPAPCARNKAGVIASSNAIAQRTGWMFDLRITLCSSVGWMQPADNLPPDPKILSVAWRPSVAQASACGIFENQATSKSAGGSLCYQL